MLWGIRSQVVISTHAAVDRQDRLGEPLTKAQLQTAARKLGRARRRPPQGVHQGSERCDAWLELDTGRALLAFPLVRKVGRDGQVVYLATTVIGRPTRRRGTQRLWRRLRMRMVTG